MQQSKMYHCTDFLISNTFIEFCHFVIAHADLSPLLFTSCCFPLDVTVVTHYHNSNGLIIYRHSSYNILIMMVLSNSQLS